MVLLYTYKDYIDLEIDLKSAAKRDFCFPKLKKNLLFLRTCSQNRKQALLKIKIWSCPEKVIFCFLSILRKWKACAPEMKIFLLY